MKPLDIQLNGNIARLNPIGQRWLRVEIFWTDHKGAKALSRQYLHDCGASVHDSQAWNFDRLYMVIEDLRLDRVRTPLIARGMTAEEGADLLWREFYSNNNRIYQDLEGVK